MWHLDGYENLGYLYMDVLMDNYFSTFLLKLNVVFSFSRKLLWLKAGSSSSDPSVVLYYFLNAVKDRTEWLIYWRCAFRLYLLKLCRLPFTYSDGLWDRKCKSGSRTART